MCIKAMIQAMNLMVILTIMNGKDHIAKAAESGDTGFIGKPFTLTDFQRHIRRMTDRTKAV